MTKATDLGKDTSKSRKFLVIILSVIALGAILSLIAKVTVLSESPSERSRIAVVAPLSGANAEIGVSMRRGVELFVAMNNAKGGIRGHMLVADVIDDSQDAGQATAQAAKIIADDHVVGVIGHWGQAPLQAAAPAYAASGLCLVSLSQASPGDTNGPCRPRALGVPLPEQARFMANYARNVMQQKLMYMVREEGEASEAQAQSFVETFNKYGIALRQTWMLPSAPRDPAPALDKMMQELRDRPDVGAVFLAVSPALAAKTVKAMRDAGSHLNVFGLSPMATSAFLQASAQAGGKRDSGAEAGNGAMVATPLLLDTANEQAQDFNAEYQRAYGTSPDWVAAYAFDAARAMASGLQTLNGAIDKHGPQNRRKAVADALGGMDSTANAHKGITGPLWFDELGHGQSSVQVGVYNGSELISAPVQLQSIPRQAASNYIAELRAGRVLYVNDRFMYKTNVVYVGIHLNEVTDIDMHKETATVDFDIWFRYAGDFSPQDMTISNTSETIKLDTPDQEIHADEINYRRYHLRKKLSLNFSNTSRSYGSHVAGLSFRHRSLNRSNLLYVVDVLGMPTGEKLLTDLIDRRVINEKSGWRPARAWISQELVRENGAGEPSYVGYSGIDPVFSRIDLGILLHSTGVELRDFVPYDYFVYIMIFGFLGSVFARSMDAKRLGRYWAVQSWLMRVMFWPLLLLSAGNMALELSFQHFSLPIVQGMVLVYESTWWIVAAILVDVALRRFLWIPLEERTGRRIPNIIKIVGTVLAYCFAGAGILAFVFGQTLTSLMATSGLVAMIIGLAIQSNIANLFSGIILNIERPFKVGDFVKVNTTMGLITDITWRTTRIEAADGQLVCLANGKVSEAEIHNFSVVPHGIAGEMTIYTQPSVPPEQVLDVLNSAIAAAPAVFGKDDPISEPSARYKGVECVGGRWVSKYSIGFRAKIAPKRSQAVEQMAIFIWRRFGELGIPLDLGEDETGMTAIQTASNIKG